MYTPKLGSAVFEVDDRRMGIVARVNPCCIEIDSPGGLWALRFTALFDVTDGGVTLICNNSQLSNYICGVHHREPVGRRASA